MKKKINALRVLQVVIIIAIVVTVIAMIAKVTSPAEVPTTEPSATVPTEPLLKDEAILFHELQAIEFPDKLTATEFIGRCEEAVNILTTELSTVNIYTEKATSEMQTELDRLQMAITTSANQVKVFDLWAQKEQEYEYATRTWKYLKDLGYSDIACAGILGNLMAECGGHTLNLDPFLYDAATHTFYGMFQWSTHWYPAAEGMSFEEQLDYYAITSIPVFENWGKEYYKGFTIDHFNRLDNPRDAALAFAKVYERCASWTYERRQDFSEVAYKYFVTDFEEAITNE